MSVFAVVRDRNDLVRACDEISDFFSFRRQQAPGGAPEPMLGIWLDSTMVREAPTSLLVRQPSLAGHSARLREFFSLSGIWVLCWLDDEGASRIALLESLLALSGDGGGGTPPGYFVPIFRRGVRDTVVQIEVRSLPDRHRQHILAPWYQDPVTGRLFPPTSRR